MTPESRKAVECVQCGLRQFERKGCRRCGRELPVPFAYVVRVEVPVVVEVVHEVLKTVEILKVVEVPEYLMSETFPTLAEVEGILIRRAMAKTDGDKQKAARLLGIGKTTLYRKLHDMGLLGNPEPVIASGHP